MKYELEPDNRNCSDDVLLGDLRDVAAKLGKDTLTQDVYNQHGRFASATFKKRFGTWNSVLERCGLRVQKRVNIPRNELLQDLRRVAQELNTTSVSVNTYDVHGRFCHDAISKRFGSWAKAIELAGLRPSPAYNARIPDEELFDNMANVWESIGRQPKQKDFFPPISKYSDAPYIRRFGGWRKALEAFVEAANQDSEAESAPNAGELPPFASLSAEFELPTEEVKPKAKRTARDPGWRLRFLVMRRDRFTCCFCGRSPALHPGLVLDVDHILAWSKGGETTFENLQTLCQKCNGGKSNLDIQET